MIFRKGDAIYVLPENSASGHSTLYKYNALEESLEPLKIVCNRPLTDATIVEVNGLTYIFSTELPAPNGNELHIYVSDMDIGNPHLVQTKVFSKNIARNAGAPFIHEGRLIRPAQDCGDAYGKGVIFQEVKLDKATGLFDFKDIGAIYPFNFRYNLGLHTFNQYNGMCVIDGRGLLHPYIGRIIRPLANLIK